MIFSVCSKPTFHNYIISILSRLIVCFPIFEQYHARKEIVGKNRGSKEVCGNIVSCNSLSLFFFFQHFRTNCMLPWHRLYLHFHVVSDLHRLCETQSRNNFSRRKFIISFIPEVSIRRTKIKSPFESFRQILIFDSCARKAFRVTEIQN